MNPIAVASFAPAGRSSSSSEKPMIALNGVRKLVAHHGQEFVLDPRGRGQFAALLRDLAFELRLGSALQAGAADRLGGPSHRPVELAQAERLVQASEPAGAQRANRLLGAQVLGQLGEGRDRRNVQPAPVSPRSAACSCALHANKDPLLLALERPDFCPCCGIRSVGIAFGDPTERILL